MDLPGWGDGPAGAFKPGETFAVTFDQVIIQSVIPAPKSYLGIAGLFNQRTVFCKLGPLDESTFPKVAKIVNDNKGEPLLSIGTIEIPADED